MIEIIKRSKLEEDDEIPEMKKKREKKDKSKAVLEDKIRKWKWKVLDIDKFEEEKSHLFDLESRRRTQRPKRKT